MTVYLTDSLSKKEGISANGRGLKKKPREFKTYLFILVKLKILLHCAGKTVFEIQAVQKASNVHPGYVL